MKEGKIEGERENHGQVPSHKQLIGSADFEMGRNSSSKAT
jgi:hypothetical protein